MTTIVNTPGNGEGSNSALSMIVGIIVLVIVAALFYVYVVPMIRNSESPKANSIDVNVKLPVTETTQPTN